VVAARNQLEFAWVTTSNVSHQPWPTARHNAERQKIAKWPNTPRALKLAARPNTTAKKIVPAASPSRLLGRATPFARGNQRVRQSERPSLSEAKLLAVRCQKEFAWVTTSNVSHQPWPTAKHNAKRQKIAKWPNTPRALKLAARPNTTAKKIVLAASRRRPLGRVTAFARDRPEAANAASNRQEFAWATTSNVSHRKPWPTARHNAKRQKIAKRPNTRLVALAARPNTRANLIVLVASRRRRRGRVTAFARDRPDPEAEAAANAARKQAEFAWATTSNVGQQAWPTARQHAPRQKDAKWPNTRPVAPAARPNLTAKKIVLAVSRRRRVGVVTSFVLVRPRKRPITPTTIATRNQKEFAWVTTSNVSHQPLPTARQHALGQQDAKWPNTPRALKLAARPNTTAKKIVLAASLRRLVGRVTSFATEYHREQRHGEPGHTGQRTKPLVATRNQNQFAWVTTSNASKQAWATARQRAKRQTDAKWPNTRPVALAARPNTRAKEIVLAPSRRILLGRVTTFAMTRLRSTTKQPTKPSPVLTKTTPAQLRMEARTRPCPICFRMPTRNNWTN